MSDMYEANELESMCNFNKEPESKEVQKIRIKKGGLENYRSHIIAEKQKKEINAKKNYDEVLRQIEEKYSNKLKEIEDRIKKLDNELDKQRNKDKEEREHIEAQEDIKKEIAEKELGPLFENVRKYCEKVADLNKLRKVLLEIKNRKPKYESMSFYLYGMEIGEEQKEYVISLYEKL